MTYQALKFRDDTKPLMQVFADRNGFVREIQIGDYYFERDEISAAFGHPMMTTFDRVFGEDGHRLRVHERPEKDEVSKVHQMSYRPQGQTTWTIVDGQQIIDRVIAYRIEQEEALLNAIEEKLNSSNTALIATEDVKAIPGEASLEEFLASIKNQQYTVTYPEITPEAHDKIMDAEFWEIDEVDPDPVHEGDARSLLEQLGTKLPLLQNFNGQSTKVKKQSILEKFLGSASQIASNVSDVKFKINDVRKAKTIEGAAILAAVALQTTLLPQMDIIQPDRVVETDVAANRAAASAAPSANEEQVCVNPPIDRLQVRMDMWHETEFYRTHVNGNAVERRQVKWIEDAATASRDAWAANESYFRHAGFESPDHMFMIAVRFGAIESFGNLNPRNSRNPSVLGPYHIDEDTFTDLIRKHRWVTNLPGFNGETPGLNKRMDGYISTVVMLALIVDDNRVAENILGQSPNSYLGSLYSYYATHVDGSVLFSRMARAAIEEPTKMQNGRRVLKTAADIAGSTVVNDNPSLFYRYATIESNGRSKRIAIPRTPSEHLQELRRRMLNDDRVGNMMVLANEVNTQIRDMRANDPQYAPRCTTVAATPEARIAA